MNPITPATWQRMPWHPRAQLIAQLDREARAAEARRDRAITRRHTADEIAATRDAAQAHLEARGGPDPEGPARLALLYAEVRAARKRP